MKEFNKNVHYFVTDDMKDKYFLILYL